MTLATTWARIPRIWGGTAPSEQSAKLVYGGASALATR